MLWYVGFIAALNLCAGYYWGAHLRRCPRCALTREAEILALSPTPIRGGNSRPIPASDGAAISGTSEEVISGATAAESISDDATAAANPVDPKTALATREYAEQLLAKLATAGIGSPPATVALVEIDRLVPRDGEVGEAMDERLFRGISSIVRQSLELKDTAACFADQQLLLLVPEEDVNQATRRAEELRQRIASTEFVADGRAFQTTVTCALTEISPESSVPRLFEFLEEALGEAKRYGGNRTFMHDGNSPTPVVPTEIPVAPQQLAI
jgi:PleD family two-component response regulator